MGFSSVAPSGGSVNVTNIAQTVWSYSPRSLTDIQSLVNAIKNNDPNLLSTLSDLPFIPAPMYAGQVSLTQVASFVSNLVQNYRAQGVIASFINSNPYSLWHMDFVDDLLQNPYLGFTNASLILNGVSRQRLAEIATSTSVPVTSLLSFISNAALSGDAAQGLLYGLAENYYYNKWLDTVTYNAPPITFSTNATLSTNVLIAQEITVASGVTVTCGTRTCFFITQVFNNQGTIACPYGAPGGPACPGYGGGGAGGAGGGGVVIISYTATIGTISVNGDIGGTAYYNTGAAYCGGSKGVGGEFAIVSGISVPIGGNGPTTGYYQPGGAGEPNAGGGGGGGYTGGYAGGSATVYSFTNGNELITYAVQGVSDWWLSNVVGKTPSTVTPLLYVYGSGGGSGGESAPGWGGAGGGGGGGEVIVFGDEVNAGSVSAVGGTGGYNPGNLGGGGGGAGGIVLVFYGSGGLKGTMSLNLAAGPGGVSASGPSGLAGQTGVYLATSVIVNG